MSKLIPVTCSHKDTGELILYAYRFMCPGCNDWHQPVVNDAGYGGAVWGFNGDVNKPTFTPSLLVRSGHYVPREELKDTCWCTYRAEHKEDIAQGKWTPECYLCHSFINNGYIQFLGDCTHPSANQTVLLPDIIEEEKQDIVITKQQIYVNKHNF